MYGFRLMEAPSLKLACERLSSWNLDTMVLSEAAAVMVYLNIHLLRRSLSTQRAVLRDYSHTQFQRVHARLPPRGIIELVGVSTGPARLHHPGGAPPAGPSSTSLLSNETPRDSTNRWRDRQAISRCRA